LEYRRGNIWRDLELTSYKGRGYCSLCQKWWDLKEAKLVYFKKTGVYSFYCPIHKKQLRLKPRGKPMREVKISKIREREKE